MNQILLKRIELFKVAVEPVADLVAAHGVIGPREVILVRVWDGDGAYGWGECIALPEPGYVTETVAIAWEALVSGILPAVHNRRFDSPDRLADYLANSMPQTPIAAACVEMASWDLVARRHGHSLAKFLGGTRNNIATGRTLGLMPIPDLVTKIDAAARDGYQRIKIKIEPKRALSTATDAVKAAGTLPVVADANASFSHGDVQVIRELDAAGLAWIEQPFAAASLRAIADLRDSIRTPVALDESVSSVNATRRIIEMKAAHGLSIKPGRLGGHAAARQVYGLAKSEGLSLWIGGMLETGVGRAHNLALASLAGFDVPGDMGPSKAYWKRDVITEPIEMVAGHVPVPDGPGIGVEVDTEYLRTAATGRHVVS